jgi:hypothetical protein
VWHRGVSLSDLKSGTDNQDCRLHHHHHHSSLLKLSTKKIISVGGMAGIEPQPSKLNDWTVWTPLLPCQLSQGGDLIGCIEQAQQGQVMLSPSSLSNNTPCHTSFLIERVV